MDRYIDSTIHLTLPTLAPQICAHGQVPASVHKQSFQFGPKGSGGTGGHRDLYGDSCGTTNYHGDVVENGVLTIIEWGLHHQTYGCLSIKVGIRATLTIMKYR